MDHTDFKQKSEKTFISVSPENPRAGSRGIGDVPVVGQYWDSTLTVLGQYLANTLTII